MKITKSYLKQIIKEELSQLAEQPSDLKVTYAETFPGGTIAGVTIGKKQGSVVLTKDGKVLPGSRIGNLTPEQSEQVKTGAQQILNTKYGANGTP